MSDAEFRKEEYEYMGETYELWWLSDKTFRYKLEDFREMTGHHVWYWRWIRGFLWGSKIYLKESTWFGRKKLIIHEIGHVLGHEHTYWPTTMNRWAMFRWFKEKWEE
jgi:hypothetical protein